MLQIILSLPVAFFVYNVIFGINYFMQMHVLAIFLVLGIGADDMFVFTDAFKQSGRPGVLPPAKDGEDAALARLCYAFNRAVFAVFNTSFTTSVAFLATGISPVMPISSFGIFAATAILVNYVFCITLTPACVLVHHYNRKKTCAEACMCCCAAHPRGQGGDGFSDGAIAPGGSGAKQGGAAAAAAAAAADETGGALAQGGAGGAGGAAAGSETGKLDKWFETVYTPKFLATFGDNESATTWKRPVPLAVLAAMSAYFAGSLYAAMQLTAPVEQEQWFAETHMFQRFVSQGREDFTFGAASQYNQIDMVWGVAGLDRAGFNRYEPDINRGTPVYDAAFDLADPAARAHVAATCQALRDHVCAVARRARCRGNTLLLLFFHGSERRCIGTQLRPRIPRILILA